MKKRRMAKGHKERKDSTLEHIAQAPPRTTSSWRTRATSNPRHSTIVQLTPPPPCQGAPVLKLGPSHRLSHTDRTASNGNATAPSPSLSPSPATDFLLPPLSHSNSPPFTASPELPPHTTQSQDSQSSAIQQQQRHSPISSPTMPAHPRKLAGVQMEQGGAERVSESSGRRASGSIQPLGPSRKVVLRMSMNENIKTPNSPTESNPFVEVESDRTETAKDSDGNDRGARGGKPEPIGIYEPVDEKHLVRHPERFTGDGLRRKERVYRLYEHDNCHFFRGRVVTGNKPLPFLLALVLIIAPVVVFSVFVCPYLWAEVHKASVIVFAYLAALTFASMFMSSFTDPGIIPRNLDAITNLDSYTVNVANNPAYNNAHFNNNNSSNQANSAGGCEPCSNGKRAQGAALLPGNSGDPGYHRSQHKASSVSAINYYSKLPPPWIHVGAPGRRSGPLSVYDPKAASTTARDQRTNSDPFRMYPPTTKLVTINNVSVRLKYCETCRIYRPPRASHCRYCDNCVENEDHHCIWLNNCVGRRNYRYFYTFVTSTTLLCLYVIAFSLVRLVLPLHRGYGEDSELDSFRESVKRHPVVLALLVFAFLHVWLVGGLFIYHTVLISRNMTTHEVLGAKHTRANNMMESSGIAGRARKNCVFLGNASPYSRGSCLRNWVAALCSPNMETSVPWRARVDPEGIEELIPLHS